MHIDAQMYQDALTVRKTAAKGSPAHRLAMQVIDRYRPTRRHQQRRHEEIVALVEMMRADGDIPMMLVYRHVGTMFSITPATVRKICWRVVNHQSNIDPLPSHRIPDEHPPTPV